MVDLKNPWGQGQGSGYLLSIGYNHGGYGEVCVRKSEYVLARLDRQTGVSAASTAREISAEQLDEAVEWCTLGMLRQLYTIKEQDIKSKISAVHYGLQTLPAKWHALIQEAISIKQRCPDRHYVSQLKRLSDLVGLLRYIRPTGYTKRGAGMTRAEQWHRQGPYIGWYDLPGGSIENHEFLMEAGVSVTIMKQVGVCDYLIPYETSHKEDITYSSCSHFKVVFERL